MFWILFFERHEELQLHRKVFYPLKKIKNEMNICVCSGDPRKMFTDSSFYNAKHHPTVADQVNLTMFCSYTKDLTKPSQLHVLSWLKTAFLCLLRVRISSLIYKRYNRENSAFLFQKSNSTLQPKSHFFEFPEKELHLRPRSQCPHSWVCERFIYSQDRSTSFPAAE